VKNVSKDGMGEGRESCAGDVDESKGDGEKRNGDSVSHRGGQKSRSRFI
jgi:hypothetical protein